MEIWVHWKAVTYERITQYNAVPLLPSPEAARAFILLLSCMLMCSELNANSRSLQLNRRTVVKSWYGLT